MAGGQLSKVVVKAWHHHGLSGRCQGLRKKSGRVSAFRSESARVPLCVSYDVSYQFQSYCFLCLVIVFPVMFPSFSFNNKPTGPASRDNSTGGSLRSFASGTLGRLPKDPLEPDAASEPHSSKNYRKVTAPQLPCQRLDLHGSTIYNWIYNQFLEWIVSAVGFSALVRSQLWKWSYGDVWLHERLCKICISCDCRAGLCCSPHMFITRSYY